MSIYLLLNPKIKSVNMPQKHKRTITAEDLYKIETISGIRLSPDGKYVVYASQRIDRKTEKKYTNLWIIPTATGKARQFTYGNQNDTHPRWSPDGSQIAFLSNRGDKEKPPQIYLIPISGGEAKPLTHIEGRIEDFVWSPNGKQFVCVVQKTDPDELERQKDPEKKKLGVVDRHYERVFYKLDGYGYLPKERKHLWIVNAHNGRAKQITDHKIYDEEYPAWSPDGKWIAFMSNRRKDPDFHPDAIGLYIIPATGGEMREIPTPLGEKSMPSFSPDGKWIAYFGIEGEFLWYKNAGVWVVPVNGSSSPKNLTDPYDIHVSPWTINDIGHPEQMRPTWSKDGSTLYFQTVYHGSSLLQSITLEGKN